MSTAPLVRVVFIDSCPEVLTAVARGLNESFGIDVVGLLASPHHILAVCKATQPDVVLIDPTMPNLHAPQLIRDLALACPNARALAHAVSLSPAQLDALVEAGAWGATARGWDTAPLADAILAVHNARFVLTTDLVEHDRLAHATIMSS